MNLAVLNQLEDLLSRPAAERDLSRAEIDRLLTDGYAEALELEVERIERSRRLVAIGQVVTAGPALGDDDEAALLNEELRECTELLLLLRGRLAEASRRFGRNPLADG